MSKLTTTISLQGFAGDITISPEAEAQKQQLIIAAKGIAKVTTDDELLIAAEAERNLSAMRIAVEKTRKEIKAPVLELGKRIDSIAAAFVEDIEREEKRLMGHINHFQRQVLEEQRKREEEAAKKRARLEQEAEAARQMEEKARQLREQAQQGVDPAEAEKLATEAQKLEDEALERALAAELVGPFVEQQESTGISSREVLDYEVIGINPFAQGKSLAAFAQAHPELVEIKVKRRDLLDALNSGRIAGAPGIKVIKTIKTSIR